MDLFTALRFGVVLILFTVSHSKAECEAEKNKKCADEKNIWATDEKFCYVFRTDCRFEKENCLRKSNGQQELRTVSEEECKDFCPDSCDEDLDPVCGLADTKVRTFRNACEYSKHVCTDKIWFYYEHSTSCGTIEANRRPRGG